MPWSRIRSPASARESPSTTRARPESTRPCVAAATPPPTSFATSLTRSSAEPPARSSASATRRAVSTLRTTVLRGTAVATTEQTTRATPNPMTKPTPFTARPAPPLACVPIPHNDTPARSLVPPWNALRGAETAESLSPAEAALSRLRRFAAPQLSPLAGRRCECAPRWGTRRRNSIASEREGERVARTPGTSAVRRPRDRSGDAESERRCTNPSLILDAQHPTQRRRFECAAPLEDGRSASTEALQDSQVAPTRPDAQ